MAKGFDPRAVDVARLLSGLGINAEHRVDGWVASCPSGRHEDRDPSWKILDDPGQAKNGLHYCHSCKYQGTAYELVRDVLGIVSGAVAVDWILEHAQGKLPIVTRLRVEVASLSSPSISLPEGVVQEPLERWPRPAREYALSRGITPEQVSKWRIGYAVDGRMRGRIVVPVYDERGSLLHYTGRTFTGAPKRYMEPSNEEHPAQGAVFGEQFWPPTHSRERVIITEGAINALAVERTYRNELASLFGSSIELLHIMKISTFRKALVLTDNDLAGDRAAEFLLAAFARHLWVRRVVPPKGHDAASIPIEELRTLIDAGWAGA